MNGKLKIALVITAITCSYCSKSKSDCWECTVRTQQLRNGVKFQDISETGTHCDKSESDIRAYEVSGSGDKQYNDANGDVIRRVYTTKCSRK